MLESEHHNLNSLVDGDSLLQFLNRRTEFKKNYSSKNTVRSVVTAGNKQPTYDTKFDLNIPEGRLTRDVTTSSQLSGETLPCSGDTHEHFDEFLALTNLQSDPVADDSSSSRDVQSRSCKTESSGNETSETETSVIEQENESEEDEDDEEFYLNDNLDLVPLELPQFDFSKHAGLSK